MKRWAKLAADAAFRRRENALILEGAHLVAEALQAGLAPRSFIVSETGARRAPIRALLGGAAPVVLTDRVFCLLADAESPQGIAAEIEIPQRPADTGRTCLFLEGIQDPSNVGAILRSAAAFGAGEVVLDRACADPWAPKVLRAALGAHFKLALRQAPDLAAELERFGGTTICTVARGGLAPAAASLAGRLGWIFGAEGRGVSEALARRAKLKLTIPMAAGNESINVAAAAAICLYEGFRNARTGP